MLKIKQLQANATYKLINVCKLRKVRYTNSTALVVHTYTTNVNNFVIVKSVYTTNKYTRKQKRTVIINVLYKYASNNYKLVHTIKTNTQRYTHKMLCLALAKTV